MTKVVIDFHGPAAVHNMPCAVCHVRPAVYQFSTGVFQPCWSCRETWELRRVPWWRDLFSRNYGTRYRHCESRMNVKE